MDLTSEYIEMCSKAQEIQELRKHSFEHADFYCDGYNNGKDIQVYFTSYSDLNSHDENCFGTEKGENVWLIRQDQLQNIVDHSNFGFTSLQQLSVEGVELKYRAVNLISYQVYVYGFGSFEQLWLAFVMKEKYNKQWNFETKEWEVVK